MTILNILPLLVIALALAGIRETFRQDKNRR